MCDYLFLLSYMFILFILGMIIYPAILFYFMAVKTIVEQSYLLT